MDQFSRLVHDFQSRETVLSTQIFEALQAEASISRDVNDARRGQAELIGLDASVPEPTSSGKYGLDAKARVRKAKNDERRIASLDGGAFWGSDSPALDC
jgi:hypothetical protein